MGNRSVTTSTLIKKLEKMSPNVVYTYIKERGHRYLLKGICVFSMKVKLDEHIDVDYIRQYKFIFIPNISKINKLLENKYHIQKNNYFIFEYDIRLNEKNQNLIDL